MKRLLALTSFALSALALRAAAPAATQLNLVWIVADDMSLDLAAFGATGVKTPNLDRLAARGRRYTRAYVSLAHQVDAGRAVVRCFSPHFLPLKRGLKHRATSLLPASVQSARLNR